MISIIICSIKPLLLEQVKENIQKTIGVDFEFLVYDNRAEKKGICEVYNLLGAKAKYDILCFIHEDVIIKTQKWGEILYNTFDKSVDIGVLGIAGSKYKSARFSGWFTGQNEFDRANVFHYNSFNEQKIYLNPGNKDIEEVVCLDGVFIACRKAIWMKIKFNEKELQGFHLYDLDFSLRASKICSVQVTFLIDLIHLTHGGDFSDRWVEITMEYHKLHRDDLPYTKEKIVSNTSEIEITRTTLDSLKTQKISWRNKKEWIKLQQLYLYPILYYSIIKFLFYQPFRIKYIHRIFK